MTEDNIMLWQHAAEQGDTEAQYALGCCYYLGDGVETNPTVSAAWMKKAAENGHLKAQHTLGMYYYNGTGVLQDYRKAAEWLELAAEQGDSGANDMLGACYYMIGMGYYCGDKESQDFEQANRYFSRAARRGLVEANYILGMNYANGVGVEEPNYKKAFQLFQSAMEMEEDTPGSMAVELYQTYGVRGKKRKQVSGFLKRNIQIQI